MKKYGSFSDEDLNEWERLPMPSIVLTSKIFGAWLIRRDSYRDVRILENIKAEIIKMRSEHNCSCSDCLDIIDKYMNREEK